MSLLIPLDFPAPNLPGAFTATKGDVISITHGSWLPGGHMSPGLRASVVDGPDAVEVLGSFQHGAVTHAYQSDQLVTEATKPAPSTVLVQAIAPGTSTIVVATDSSPDGESFTLVITVIEPRSDLLIG